MTATLYNVLLPDILRDEFTNWFDEHHRNRIPYRSDLTNPATVYSAELSSDEAAVLFKLRWHGEISIDMAGRDVVLVDTPKLRASGLCDWVKENPGVLAHFRAHYLFSMMFYTIQDRDEFGKSYAIWKEAVTL